MMRSVFAVGSLAAVYVLTLGSMEPLDLAAGVLLGMLVRQAVGSWSQRTATAGVSSDVATAVARPLTLLRFMIAVLGDVALGTWDVALRVLHLRSLSCPGVVEVPIGERSARGVAVTALVMTLSPGSVLLTIDWDRGVMLFHFIDASDPERIRARQQHFYDRWQRAVFP